MRIRVFSDLHLEFGAFEPPKVEADVVVLAGDIHTAGRGPAWAMRNFDCPVVYVPGNHDFWSISLDRFRREAEKALERVPQEGRKCPQLHVLDGGQTVEIEGVRFIGAPLWMNFEFEAPEGRDVVMARARRRMNDYRKIRHGAEYSRLSPARVLKEHTRHREAIEAALATPFGGATVLVTHHPWHPACIRPDDGDGSRSFYGSDLRDAFLREEWQLDLVISGHTHLRSDFLDRGVPFVSNPRGYVPDDIVRGFDPALVVDLPLQQRPALSGAK